MQVLWLTGPPASGKSSIAGAALLLKPELILLDADDLRKNLWPELGLSEEDRRKNVLRIAWLAKKFSNHPVVVACIAPYRDLRDEVRKLIGEDFKEIYVEASLENRIARDPKGLYQKAIQGQIHGLTGYDAPYEEPLLPDLVINTNQVCILDAAQLVVDL